MVYTWLLLDVLAREEQKYECMRYELHEPGKYTGNDVKGTVMARYLDVPNRVAPPVVPTSR